MGRPRSDRLKRCDLVECQVQATCVAANVEADAIDPGWRRTDDGNLIDRGQLCGDA